METRVEKWDQRFLKLCEEIAQWSKDPSTKTAAVLVRPDLTIAAAGYNGFPRGFDDDKEFYENREQKYLRVIHAEMNALLTCRDPIPLQGYTLVSLHLPCSDCAKHAIQCGVRRFVTKKTDPEKFKRWRSDHTLVFIAEANARIVWYG